MMMTMMIMMMMMTMMIMMMMMMTMTMAMMMTINVRLTLNHTHEGGDGGGEEGAPRPLRGVRPILRGDPPGLRFRQDQVAGAGRQMGGRRKKNQLKSKKNRPDFMKLKYCTKKFKKLRRYQSHIHREKTIFEMYQYHLCSCLVK